MHISLKAMAPGLRAAGALQRLLPSKHSRFTFRAANALSKLFWVGRHDKGMRVEEKQLERPDGSALRICVYQPHMRGENVPALLWIHGGGLSMGCPEQEEGIIRQFVDAEGCVVVSPDYRRSVEAPYPAALDDCYLALRYLRAHAAEYGARPDQLFVAGGSAGGGLTAALTLYARDQGEIAVAFQMPWYPMIDDRMITPSSQDNDDPVWSSGSNRAAWECYLGSRCGGDDVPIYAAPARAQDLSGLPPTLTFCGSLEAFRDETVAYVRRLEAAGVPVQFRMFDGCYHAFQFTAPRAKISREAVAFYMAGFRDAAAHRFAPQPVPAPAGAASPADCRE